MTRRRLCGMAGMAGVAAVCLRVRGTHAPRVCCFARDGWRVLMAHLICDVARTDAFDDGRWEEAFR